MIKNWEDASPEIRAERPRVDELINAFEDIIEERLPLNQGTILHAALELLCRIISTYDDPSAIGTSVAGTLARYWSGPRGSLSIAALGPDR